MTASQDRTAKIWDLSSLAEDSERQDQDEVKGLRSLTTQKIHDKDINSLDISPNDKLLVSGSQDRTAKLFSIDYEKKGKNSESKGKLTQLGVFKGHKRGVWSVKFSSTDQCLATASGDRTVKLWSLGDFACIKVCLLFFVSCEHAWLTWSHSFRLSKVTRTRCLEWTLSLGACN